VILVIVVFSIRVLPLFALVSMAISGLIRLPVGVVLEVFGRVFVALPILPTALVIAVAVVRPLIMLLVVVPVPILVLMLIVFAVLIMLLIWSAGSQ
jgi:hypothetical protein